MFGGKLIGEGSESCVFKPNIPCKGKRSSSDKRVSKIIYHDKSKKAMNDEKKENKMISKIKNYQDWAIIFDEYCKSPDFKTIEKYDKDINVCLSNRPGQNLYKIKDDFDGLNSHMLNGPAGGESMDTYFNNNFMKIKTIPQLNKEFLKLMNMMKSLFLGIKELKKHKIVHNDIKYQNIILQKNNFKFIDFGISGKTNNIKLFRNRSIQEMQTNRIYIFYPLEYIYISSDYVSLLDELGNPQKRDNFKLFDYLFYCFNIDAEKVHRNTINEILDGKLNISDIIKKLDVYSLGSLVPLMFYNSPFRDMHYYMKKSEIISDFFNLFQKMCEPICTLRIDADEAYNQFTKLLKKHNKTLKKTSKKTLKRVQRRTPRRVQRRTPRRVQRRTPRRVQRRTAKRVQRRTPRRVQRRTPRRVQRRTERVQRRIAKRVQRRTAKRVQRRTAKRVR